MILLSAQDIEMSFGVNFLFRLNRLEVNTYDIIGIVGKNGYGKSTLLNILAGTLTPDKGTVKRFADISYYRQFNSPDSEKIKNYSGGELTKIFLRDAIDENSMLLFLDEPTSNLDIYSIKLLEKQIKTFNGAVIIISHDKKMLSSVCTKIIEINNRTATVFDVGYDEFLDIKKKGFERDVFLYEEYNREKRRLTESIRERAEKSRNVKKAPSRMGNSEARLHKRSAGERMESVDSAGKALLTRMEKLEVHEKPRTANKIGIGLIENSGYKGRFIIEAENISLRFDENILFEAATIRIKTGSKTALIGNNGTGKTSLLKMILGKEQNIKMNAKNVAYFSQNLNILEGEYSILENVKNGSPFGEQEARDILGRLDIRLDNVHKKVKDISGGEKVKVCFAKIFTRGADLCILDEPTNYLDTDVTETLIDIINEYNGTLLVISHDRSFLENFADDVVEICGGKVIQHNLSFIEYEKKT